MASDYGFNSPCTNTLQAHHERNICSRTSGNVPNHHALSDVPSTQVRLLGDGQQEEHGVGSQHLSQHTRNYIYPRHDREWHKITVKLITSGIPAPDQCFFQRLGRECIQSYLRKKCKKDFTPFVFSVKGNHAEFYVMRTSEAMELAKCHGTNFYLANWLIDLQIEKNIEPPYESFNGDCTQRMETELKQRYNKEHEHLSLSRFCMTPDLANNNFLPLNRKSVVFLLLYICKPLLRNLKSIDISSNQLVSLKAFASLKADAQSLVSLNLSRNKFRDLGALEWLQGMQIQDLNLEKNPLCERFRDENEYISEIRTIFPMIVKLDGINLRSLESSKPAQMVQNFGEFVWEAWSYVEQFWRTYQKMFDSNGRCHLAMFYHEDAMLLASVLNQNQQPHAYNLFDWKKRIGHQEGSVLYHKTYQEKHRIEGFLQMVPTTRHVSESCYLAMPIASRNCICFNVRGCFEEFIGTTNTVRNFLRSFEIFKNGHGFLITRESFLIEMTPSEANKFTSDTLDSTRTQQQWNFRECTSTSLTDYAINTQTVQGIGNHPQAISQQQARIDYQCIRRY